MTLSDLIQKLKARPLIALLIGLLGPIIVQRVLDNAIVTDAVLLLSCPIIAYEILSILGKRNVWSFVITTALAMTLFYFLLYQHPNHFTIYFDGSPLDKRVIGLSEYDPLKPSQMIVEGQPTPSAFALMGIYAINDGTKLLEADSALISFSTKVQKLQENAGVWRAAAGPDGWTTFAYGFFKNSTEPGHPLGIERFDAKPIPTQDTKVRITLAYGTNETTANFTIKPEGAPVKEASFMKLDIDWPTIVSVASLFASVAAALSDGFTIIVGHHD